MDPLEEYITHKEYIDYIKSQQKKSLGVDDERDIIGAGPSLSGVENIEYPILKILPPGYKIVPAYLVGGEMGELVGGIIDEMNELNRPVAKNLFKILGKGMVLLPHKKIYGGFGISDIKNFISGAKSDINAFLNNPLDIGGQVAMFLFDIAPYMIKYGKQIVDDPLNSVDIITNYINDITPYVNKYANKLTKISRGAGFCCANCALGKKCSGGCMSCMSGGISADILNDPEFKSRLNKRKMQLEDKHDDIIHEKEKLKNDFIKANEDKNQRKLVEIQGVYNQLANEEGKILGELQNLDNQDIDKVNKLNYYPEDNKIIKEAKQQNKPSYNYDIPYSYAEKYINFTLPDLPEYVRYRLTMNLYKSFNNYD